MWLPSTIKNILLIHPPGNRVIRRNGERGLKASVVPLGIAYLAAVLETNSYQVSILDTIIEGYNDPEVEVEPEIFRYGMTDDRIATAIEHYRPDIICISLPQIVRLYEAISVATIAKKVSPWAAVVMGGASVSALRQEILSMTSDIDFLIQGEGEMRLLALLEALKEGGRRLQNVPGLIYRDKEKYICVNDVGEAVLDIDKLPLPAYNLLPMEKYFEQSRNPSVHSSAKRTSIMISSRGCPSTCYYCPVHNVFGPIRPHYRMRSNKSVLDEIALLTEQYGVDEIQFEDANFNASIKRTISLSNAIAERFPGLRWSTPHGNQMSTLTFEVMSAMRRGGCTSLHVAIESGNQDFLMQHKKSVKLSKIDHLMQTAKDLGFFRSTFFMIGFPEETREDIQRTVDYAKTVDMDDAHFFISIPFPGTKMYEICKQEKQLIPELSFRHFRYSLGVMRTEHFDPSYLQSVRRSAWLDIRHHIEKDVFALQLSQMETKIYG